MIRRISITCLILGAMGAMAHAAALRIGWSDLRPSGQPEWILGQTDKPEDSPAGDVLTASLASRTIEMTGFLLPVDREGEMVYEALLVPEPGGCSHTAQPPANQLVHVFANPPYRLQRLYEPVTVTGKLIPGVEQLQVIIVDGVRNVDAGYRLSRATIVHADGLRAKGYLPRSKDAPWSFLKK